MTAPLTLSLVIPVYNDTENLIRTLRRAAELGCFERVIVMDDRSEPPITRDLITPKNTPENWLSLHHNPTQLGPGSARNRGLDLVQTSHLLYLDSDDLLTPALPDLLAELAVDPAKDSFDFCLFKHHDSRMKTGLMDHDAHFWQQANLPKQTLVTLDPSQTTLLAQTANYPWNKIYRTAFLRQSGARCSDILLHEDVALHWQSFVYARKILVSPRIIVEHFVLEDGQRLTNLRGRERLDFFNILPALFSQVRAVKSPDLTLPFLQFVTGLFYWIEDNTTPDLRRTVRRRAGAFLKIALQDIPLQQIKSNDLDLYTRIKDQKRRGRLIRLPSLRRLLRKLS